MMRIDAHFWSPAHSHELSEDDLWKIIDIAPIFVLLFCIFVATVWSPLQTMIVDAVAVYAPSSGIFVASQPHRTIYTTRSTHTIRSSFSLMSHLITPRGNAMHVRKNSRAISTIVRCAISACT
ncbi:hypothetical protein F2Q69_00039215 [Brassica cretica]|uniref:Uncharacterized protein n=1 Tax=Brassica cretica TaxID=69181 RepID=A0A8S9SIM3_BRACR|nr:hypothetical protein F2Q69_00039216 [Brassica cretica]KAF3600632.1 hypothetical protein F2Q69_00039215 [Brassica cretica]